MAVQRDAGASSVLFVEDHLDLASVQKLLLESRGHFVTIATDWHQAMEALRHFKPDAVLMDMGLPGGLSGADLLVRMKALPDLVDCRFICTSGRQESEVPWRDLGFDAFLRKPSSLDDIVDTLTN
jgi:CheY-like chemotaxis protein